MKSMIMKITYFEVCSRLTHEQRCKCRKRWGEWTGGWLTLGWWTSARWSHSLLWTQHESQPPLPSATLPSYFHHHHVLVVPPPPPSYYYCYCCYYFLHWSSCALLLVMMEKVRASWEAQLQVPRDLHAGDVGVGCRNEWSFVPSPPTLSVLVTDWWWCWLVSVGWFCCCCRSFHLRFLLSFRCWRTSPTIPNISSSSSNCKFLSAWIMHY